MPVFSRMSPMFCFTDLLIRTSSGFRRKLKRSESHSSAFFRKSWRASYQKGAPYLFLSDLLLAYRNNRHCLTTHSSLAAFLKQNTFLPQIHFTNLSRIIILIIIRLIKSSGLLSLIIINIIIGLRKLTITLALTFFSLVVTTSFPCDLWHLGYLDSHRHLKWIILPVLLRALPVAKALSCLTVE